MNIVKLTKSFMSLIISLFQSVLIIINLYSLDDDWWAQSCMYFACCFERCKECILRKRTRPKQMSSSLALSPVCTRGEFCFCCPSFQLAMALMTRYLYLCAAQHRAALGTLPWPMKSLFSPELYYSSGEHSNNYINKDS